MFSGQLNKMKAKMKAKNVMFSFLAIATVLLLASMVSADLAENVVVKVDGKYALYQESEGNFTNGAVMSVIAGDEVEVEVYFTAGEDDTYVTLEAELEGDKVDSEAVSEYFDVETGYRYDQSLKLKVPFELKDAQSDDLKLYLEIDGKDGKTVIEPITLRVQRPSFNPEVMSITFDSTVDAGETFPVDVVIKNMGYNELEDLYVTVSIPELGVVKGPTYFDDLSWEEVCSGDCEEDDTVSGRLYLEVPYGTTEGTYTLQVKVTNDETTLTESKPVFVANSFNNEVIVAGTSKNVMVGEEAEFTMLLVNPTNKLKVYSVVTESSGSLSSSVSETVVAVPAGSSETVRIYASADSEGEYTFNANVLEGSRLVSTTAFNLNAEAKDSSFAADPMVILTIVLAVVFLVLLVVLIVLIGKKPSKTEEFGESYY